MNSLQSLLLDQIAKAPGSRRLFDHLKKAKPGKPFALKGLRGSSLAAVLADVAMGAAAPEDRPPFILLVTGNYERSGELYDDACFFGLEHVYHYPRTQLLPYDEDEPLLEEQVKHLEFLRMLAELAGGAAGAGQSHLGVTSIEALFSRVPTLQAFNDLTVRVEFGQPFDPENFADRAVDLGYERVPTVETRGEFSVRGGIVDVFPPDAENPIRIDLFGDEIESIRYFDVHTQRSLKSHGDLELITLLPAREKTLLTHATSGDCTQLPTLLDLLPAESLLVFDTVEVYTTLDERFQQLVQRQYREHGEGKEAVCKPEVLYATLEEVQKAASRFKQVHHGLLVEAEGAAQGVTFDTTSFETIKPSLEHYLTQMRRRMPDGYSTVIVCDNDGQAQRMDEMLRENEIGAFVFLPEKATGAPLPVNEDNTRDVIITVGLLHAGFVMPDAGVYIVTDREIFGRYKRRHVYRKIYKGAPIADAREIHKGDYVVHLDHGIGRFEGIRTQNIDGKVTDFLELIYSGDDKLLVPVEKISYVQKFSGVDGNAPTLDKLGSKKWAQRRKKSQEDIEKLAKELLGLHAKRAMARGHAYGSDSHFQREFESSFLYQETPDQLRAIEDVKMDMAGNKPMDRLVCGDVGYGKTEVAIRAAFKGVMDKKQVALLCPTTILARQHYDNFRERFADYPIKVEMLSRFRTPKETKEVLKGLAEGTVDMVVGTHQLLSKSIQFKDLGLVIVDEEQRFGVAHKERLKELRSSVDFLTLTATPIPRTLYMALSGLRDMSIINTPPADRHPIKTKIINWDREQIEEAVLRELNRGGQVFFVHNRVQNIHQIADKIREIIPHARIQVAHGQMNEHDLEQIILDFIDQKYDILVSTTIIESGIDIPNVNTIIINRADAFGLAQLYQLRGRVGRETRRAYAYLIVPSGQAITESAVARLQAIEEFTELGVGFNIAMRDMEIRGTGNLLGKEQHGSMNAIGYELYCKMLEEAVEEMHGRVQEEESREVEIQWKASAYLPPEYVPVEGQRVMLYKRVAEARTPEELDEIAAEVKDRYGDVQRLKPGTTDEFEEAMPEPVENLFLIARMRMLGRRLDLRKIVGLKSGFKFVKENALAELGRRAQKLVSASGPEIYADDPDALEFGYKDWSRRRGVVEAMKMLEGLQKKGKSGEKATSAEKGSSAEKV